MTMRVLVLGRSGQLARALRAAAGDHVVEAIGRPDYDLAKLPALDSAIAHFRPDVVVNAAGYTAVDKAESEPDAAFAANEQGAANAANAARSGDALFVHVSTDYVFDGTEGRPYLESDPPHPLGVYARSKRAGEIAVGRIDPQAFIVRTSGLFDEAGANFVGAVARRLASTGEARIVSDQRLNPTYAPDLAAALLALAEAGLAGTAEGGLYHAAGIEAATWLEVGEAIADTLRQRGIDSQVTPTTTGEWGAAAPRPPDSRLDCGKLARVAGLQLPGWRESVAHCAEMALET